MNHVEHNTANGIGFITLNRPEKRNALSAELIAELKQAFVALEKDDEARVIVLHAKGEVFCAGADLAYLKQLQGFSEKENLEDSRMLKELLLMIYTLKKVVIAQVQGHAVAGGCGLASVCDFVFTVPEAKFGYTEVRIGFIPAIVMVFLLRKIGEAKVKQLLLGGELVSAEEAYQLGIVTKVVSREDLESEVISFAQNLLVSNSVNSMMITKQMIAQVQSMPLAEALEYAAEMNARTRTSDDFKKGMSAFLDKKKIVW